MQLLSPDFVAILFLIFSLNTTAQKKIFSANTSSQVDACIDSLAEVKAQDTSITLDFENLDYVCKLRSDSNRLQLNIQKESKKLYTLYVFKDRIIEKRQGQAGILETFYRIDQNKDMNSISSCKAEYNNDLIFKYGVDRGVIFRKGIDQKIDDLKLVQGFLNRFHKLNRMLFVKPQLEE